MKLLLSKPRGFCAGVVRAIETVKLALKKWGPPIYVKHQIVHNRHVVEELRKLGAVFIEDLTEVPQGSYVIYSAHGVTPEVREIARKRALVEVDATCGLVTRVHSAAKRFAKLGYYILLIGHRDHVEVIGTAAQAPKSTTIIESLQDVDNLCFPITQKLFYTTQTTLGLEDVKEIIDHLQKKYPYIETLPTSSICYATTNRQLALKQIAAKSDLILVVGDNASSNSNRLQELGEKCQIPTYLINDEREIKSLWLDNKKIIGLTAGASTPEYLVSQCVEKLQTLGVTEIEELSLIEENVFFQLPKEVLVR